MDDRILAETLVKKNLLAPEGAQKLLNEARDSRRRLEDIIYYRRLIPEIEVTKAKSEILKIPYKPVKADTVPEEALKAIQQETAQNYKVMPITKEGNMLVVGMVNPDDTRAQEALRYIAKEQNLSLGVYIVSPSDWEMVLRRYVSYKSEIDAALKALTSKSGKAFQSAQKMVSLEEGISVAEEAPIIKIVSSTLKNAVALNASDIHIEPQKTRVRIRFRLDGKLTEVASLPIELEQPVVSRVKILADLKIDETRVPQDGRFRTFIFGRDVDFRVATFPTPSGEKVAIRVLDSTIGLKGIEKLGVQDRGLNLLMEAIKKPFGMILVTGPTGSGKSTTLYSVLQILNSEDSNILSLEDPVEYFIEGVNQSQVHPDIGYDFSSGLRQILRQDPDVIMVGEIRDAETAKLAVHAALTGHIVLSTLHTNNAIGVIPRLIDMGVDSFLLPSALNLMIGQRLVRRICDNCKAPVEPPKEVVAIIKEEMAKIKPEILSELKLETPYKVYQAPGCKVCGGKGITGRIAIFEVLSMTPELGKAIGADMNESAIEAEARSQGMITLRQDGIIKALRGLVSIEEVLRETA